MGQLTLIQTFPKKNCERERKRDRNKEYLRAALFEKGLFNSLL